MRGIFTTIQTMKTKLFFSTLFVLLFSIVETSAQVGIGTTNPQGALDITSTNDGLLIPRVALDGTLVTTPLLTAPTHSEIVYNTNNNSALPAPVLAVRGLITPGFYFWNSTVSRWERFVTGQIQTGWMTTGNSGLNATTNFLGTTDNVDVSFRRNNVAAGRIGATSTSFGVSALASNTAANNTAFGVNALAINTDKVDNTAIGYNALSAHNTSPSVGNGNTAVGSEALRSLAGGTLNTAVGFEALRQLGGITQFNTAVGALAMRNASANATQDNVAVGYNAMGATGATITGCVAVGVNALISANNNTTRNTAIGFNAGSNITSGNRNIIIGADAQAPVAGNSDQVRIGGTNITYAGIQVGWDVTSDKRWKNNINDSVLGLDFIQTLRPVSYVRNNDVNARIEFGFIAQEIETALNKVGSFNNSIVSKDDAGMYGVRYNDFISISIKAIQEQQEQIEELKKTNEELLKINREILKRLEALENK